MDQQRKIPIVLDAVQCGDQMELLENEPDVLSAESSDGGFFHRPAIRAEDFQFSFVRLQSASDDADERGLSAAGRTNEHGDVPTAHIEVDSFEDLKASTAVAEATFYTAKPSGQLVLRIGLANGNIGHDQKGVNREDHGWLQPSHTPDANESGDRTDEKNHSQHRERHHHRHVKGEVVCFAELRGQNHRLKTGRCRSPPVQL